MSKKLVSLLLAVLMLFSVISFAAAEEPVEIVMYLWGNECSQNQSVLDVLNEKMKADLGCYLTVKYLPWDVKAVQYPLIFTSGEEFDLAYVYASGYPNIQGLAEEGALLPMDEYLADCPAILEGITDWAPTSYMGKIYAVPCMSLVCNPKGYAYRTDLADVEVKDWASMEAYMAAVKATGMYPINGSAGDGYNLYQMFTDSTKGWIAAPGIDNGSVYLCGESLENYTKLLSPVFTDEFVDFCKMTKSWADQGFWPTDILAASNSAKDNMNNGISAGFLSHMADWTGNYGNVVANLGADVKVNWWSPAVDNDKVINNTGAEDATGLSATGKHPELAAKVIEKLLTDKEYWMMFQYGIEGVQYDMVDGNVVGKEGADFGFCGWAFSNDAFVSPQASEDPIRYEYKAEWAKTAHTKPYVGFNLDTANISAELAAISDVNAELGIQLLLGKAGDDVEAAVENYRSMLKLAGIDTVIAEVESQLTAWAATR